MYLWKWYLPATWQAFLYLQILKSCVRRLRFTLYMVACSIGSYLSSYSRMCDCLVTRSQDTVAQWDHIVVRPQLFTSLYMHVYMCLVCIDSVMNGSTGSCHPSLRHQRSRASATPNSASIRNQPSILSTGMSWGLVFWFPSVQLFSADRSTWADGQHGTEASRWGCITRTLY